jgi:medium-chain acyl-[acyl-carrier-protein] hydrolase
MLVPPVYRRWVTCPKPRPQASLRLFCFHFAGGDASLFRLWTTQLPPSIEVCPIELPGRATRRAEEPITRFPELLEKLAGMARPFLKQLPFAFFGHSFGGITAFELTRWLRRHGGPLPVRLFLSACPALHVRQRPAPSISHLSDEEFLEQIATRFGAPHEVLASDEVRDTVLPALRADLLVAESYRYVHEAPLDVPISSFGAWEDPEVSPAEAEAWRQQTTGDFRVRMFPGNHFFLAAERKRLHQALLEDLHGPGNQGS